MVKYPAKVAAKFILFTILSLSNALVWANEEKEEKKPEVKKTEEPAETSENMSAEGGINKWIRGFAKQSDKDNPIPLELIKKIEEEYNKEMKDPKLEKDHPLNRHLMTVRAEMTQKEIKALSGPTRIIAPPGGGTIDLEDFITPLRGGFRLRLTTENEHHETQALNRVYFISHIKDRHIDGDTFGAGCDHKVYDITSKFTAAMAKGGFDLYTADQRYLSVLQGTFIFASYVPGALQLASLTFFDSRYHKWDCPKAL
jgi:hypothetical protein